MKEKRERLISRSGDMDLESDEEEEWGRELREAEAKLNLHLNTPPQFEESEDDGSDEDEVVEIVR